LKVNILDFCEEHDKDILLVIMDKIRRDKRKEVHARLDFGKSSKKSRKVRDGSQNSSVGTFPASPCRIGKILGIVLTVEVVLADGTLLLAEIVVEAETASVASKNHMVIPAPPTRQGPDIDITLVTGTTPVA
ncbi:hypothetical protein Tco_0337981, partial [Tanacetum coccineum]